MPSLRMIAALAVLAATLPATAQNWPTRQVTIVLPFAAGGAGDILGRIFASRLSELLGQPVIFENVGGAGGMTGASRVAKAAPDGYQFAVRGQYVATPCKTWIKRTSVLCSIKWVAIRQPIEPGALD
jgi:tripartite-type tricarboxylate transporter receptor subunit TctC